MPGCEYQWASFSVMSSGNVTLHPVNSGEAAKVRACPEQAKRVERETSLTISVLDQKHPHLIPLPSKGEEEGFARLQLSHFTFVFVVNADFAHIQDRHLLGQPVEILRELHVRMRVRRSGKRNPFFDRELDDAIGGIKFIYGFAPAGGGKFDREIARTNEIERFVDDRSNVAARPVSVNLDQIKMR